MAPPRRNAWLWPSLPSNATMAGLTTLVPLIVLSLGGTVVNVAIMASVYNLAYTLGPLFWGYVIDRTGWRKRVILICFSGLALSTLALFLAADVSHITILYGIVGFLSVGPTPVFSLLVMENSKKADWGTVFARLQQISVLGLIVGVVVGAVWIGPFGLRSYFLVCLIFGVFATASAQIFISEPPITFERRAIAHSLHSLAHRALHGRPLMEFLRPPSLEDFSRLARMIKTSMTRELPLFLVATLLFFSSASMYFTSFIPFLKNGGITDEGVFVTYVALYTVMVVTFPFSPRFVEQRGGRRIALLSFIPRTSGKVLTIFAALWLGGVALQITTIVAMAALALGYALFNTATSVILFEILPLERRGAVLGLYSASTGAGLFLGSLASGLISSLAGFPATFSVATGLLVGSLVVIKLSTQTVNHAGVLS